MKIFFFSLQKIGCRLKIFSNIAPQSTDRIAQIIGKEEQCITTLVEIVELIKTVSIIIFNGNLVNKKLMKKQCLYLYVYGLISADTNQRTNS